MEAIDTKVARIHRAADGIIEIRIQDGAIVEIVEIEEIMVGVEKLTDEVDGVAAVLVDARTVRSMSRAAQERTANHPLNDTTVGSAVLVGNPVSVFLGNFFIRLTRPPYPTKLFREEPAARAWLLEKMPPSESEA